MSARVDGIEACSLARVVQCVRRALGAPEYARVHEMDRILELGKARIGRREARSLANGRAEKLGSAVPVLGIEAQDQGLSAQPCVEDFEAFVRLRRDGRHALG